MSLPASTPPLLLTKRLTAFLRANQSPQLQTLLLASSHGKLLAHASHHPVSQLRTHATVAASILAIHTSSSVSVPSALPGAAAPASDPAEPAASPPSAPRHDDVVADRREAHPAPAAPVRSVKPGTVTVQLSGGTVIVRSLKCGLLFVCIGPAAGDSSTHDALENGDLVSAGTGSAAEVDSLASTGEQTTGSSESSAATAVVTMRRHVAELARWLDEKLVSLKVPDDGVGLE